MNHIVVRLLVCAAVGASMCALHMLHWSAPWSFLAGWLVGVGQSLLSAKKIVTRFLDRAEAGP